MMIKKIKSGITEKPNDMEEEIIEVLKDNLSTKIIEDLISSYKITKEDFIKKQYSNSIVNSGKFVENVFRILNFILTNEELPEIKQGKIEEIQEKLRNASSSKFSDSIRILIPQIANNLIYKPRSKSGAVHVKPVDPDYIDSKLVVSACDWIVAEFLRLYYKRDEKVVITLISNITKDYIPVIQKIGSESFITIKTDLKNGILIHLCNSSDGLTRREIGIIFKKYNPPSISKRLKLMENENEIFKANSNRYYINERLKPEIFSKYYFQNKV